MKFEEIGEKELKAIKEIYNNKDLPWDTRISMLMAMFDRSERITRQWLVKLGLKEKNVEESEEFKKAQQRKLDKKKKRFIFTWAQNSTPIHVNFWENLKAYAEFIGADIHVIAGRYKNPTSVFTDKDFDTWAEEVVPYLDANRHNIHEYLSVLADIKIQPTAHNPLSGIEGVSGMDSCIIGHPRVHMQSLPVLAGYKPKVMWTTGAVTMENYTDSKAGKKGEFHHSLGFLVIEIQTKHRFHCRQVTATDEGDFCDLFFKVENQQISLVQDADALVLGDTHIGDEEPVVKEKTVELLNLVKPDHTIIHDLMDGYSISHHDQRDPFLMYQKEKEGKNVLKTEIDNMIDWLEEMVVYNPVIVRSNHDDFLDRWLINSDWKRDIKNALEYVEYAGVLLRGEAPNGVVPYIVNRYFPQIKTLGRDDSFRVGDWELGIHGDIGSGGSRGSLNQFRRMNTKIVVGHYHGPERKDGALAVGTSTYLRVGYNKGLSNWLNSHVLIHRNGKAQHINFIEGEYTDMYDLRESLMPKSKVSSKAKTKKKTTTTKKKVKSKK